MLSVQGYKQQMASAMPVFRVSFMLGAVYWLVQSMFDALVFNLGDFTDCLLPNDPYPLGCRILVVVMLVVAVRIVHSYAGHQQVGVDQGIRRISDIEFLSRTAMEFIELPLDDDIYQFIGDRLHQLVGDHYIIINSFDEQENALRVRTIIGAGELVTSAMRLIGTHPVGLSFALTDEARHGITKGILEKADGGLYQASFGKLSKELCHQIEFIAGIDGVYGVGFARKGGIFGDAIIFTRKGKELPDLSVIEAFVNQASVALHHRKAEEELRALSLVDELTSLYNRRGFLTLAEQQVKIANRAQRGLLLLFADLDRLKWINDTLGHAEGDRAIQEAAAIMKHCFRESDIVARLGGDEFAVLAVEAGDAPPELFTTRLQQCLDAHNASASLRYALSLSVGVVTYDPNHPCPIDELLTRADALMYDQKRNKKRVARPT